MNVIVIRSESDVPAAIKWCIENIGSPKDQDTGIHRWTRSIINRRYFKISDDELATIFKLLWG